MSCYIFYNSRAGGGLAMEKAKSYAEKIGEETVYDVRKINYSDIITDERDIIIFGGDGTLNRFVNATAGLNLQNRVFICSLGTGNDFMNDLGIKPNDEPVEVTKYIKRLPICEIQGIRNYFINGVGFGIDGYCCQEGDRLKSLGKKKINYTGIAIKGLLFHFKPRNARITVDGVVHEYKKVWLAPCMFGRYYGGGMIPTPNQSRENEEGTISVMLFHGKSKLKTLIDRQLPMVLPFMVKDTESGSHPARYDMSNKRNVLISTCGFYTTEGNYDAVISMFNHLLGKDNYEKIFCSAK